MPPKPPSYIPPQPVNRSGHRALLIAGVVVDRHPARRHRRRCSSSVYSRTSRPLHRRPPRLERQRWHACTDCRGQPERKLGALQPRSRPVPSCRRRRSCRRAIRLRLRRISGARSRVASRELRGTGDRSDRRSVLHTPGAHRATADPRHVRPICATTDRWTRPTERRLRHSPDRRRARAACEDPTTWPAEGVYQVEGTPAGRRLCTNTAGVPTISGLTSS